MFTVGGKTLFCVSVMLMTCLLSRGFMMRALWVVQKSGIRSRKVATNIDGVIILNARAYEA